MAGQFVRSFRLVRKKFRVQYYYYYWCLSGQKWDMSEQKLVWPDNLTGAGWEIICSSVAGEMRKVTAEILRCVISSELLIFRVASAYIKVDSHAKRSLVVLYVFSLFLKPNTLIWFELSWKFFSWFVVSTVGSALLAWQINKTKFWQLLSNKAKEIIIIYHWTIFVNGSW